MDRRLLFPSFPPLAERWPIVEILDRIAADRANTPGSVQVSVLPDRIAFSRFTFAYYAARHALTFQVIKAWSGAPVFIDYVVTTTGEQGPARTTQQARALMTRIDMGDPTLVGVLQPLGRWPLPDGTRATLYRVASGAPPGVTGDAVADRLRTLGPEALAWALRAVQRLQVDLEPVSDEDTRAGRLKGLRLSFDSAQAGDFRRKPMALRVQSVDVTLHDVQINPYALMARGDLEVLNVERVSIRRAVVAETDVARALGQALPRVESPTVRIRNGTLELAGTVAGVPVRIVVRPDVRLADRGHVALWVERVSLGRLPLAVGLANLALRTVNPLLRLDALPVAIDGGKVLLDDGDLRVGSSRSAGSGWVRTPAPDPLGQEARRVPANG